MKRTKENVLNLIIIAVILAAVAIFSMFIISQQNYQKAMKSELPDKCATPPGYTDEQWREHMSHHPEQYTECL